MHKIWVPHCDLFVVEVLIQAFALSHERLELRRIGEHSFCQLNLIFFGAGVVTHIQFPLVGNPTSLLKCAMQVTLRPPSTFVMERIFKPDVFSYEVQPPFKFGSTQEASNQANHFAGSSRGRLIASCSRLCLLPRVPSIAVSYTH